VVGEAPHPTLTLAVAFGVCDFENMLMNHLSMVPACGATEQGASPVYSRVTPRATLEAAEPWLNDLR
jgi:hypothetical protein